MICNESVSTYITDAVTTVYEEPYDALHHDVIIRSGQPHSSVVDGFLVWQALFPQENEYLVLAAKMHRRLKSRQTNMKAGEDAQLHIIKKTKSPFLPLS